MSLSRRRGFMCCLRPFELGAVTLLAFSGMSCGDSPTAIEPGAPRIVLISLDGLRPDAVTLTNAPTLVRLAKEGASTLQAQTVPQTLTLPAHTSMVTGLIPDRHGVTWNDDSSANVARVAVPTIFDLATEAGATSAMFVGKPKLIGIVHDGSPTKVDIPPTGGLWRADTVAAHVLAYLAKANPKPNLMLIHLPDIDLAGHAYGWMSPQYLVAVRHTDSLVANILLGLTQAFGSDVVLILTADHGGSGSGHSDGSPLSRTIPWIAWGRDVSPQRLTTDVRAVDIGPTMLWVLGLTPPTDWDGVPLKNVFPTIH